MVSGLQKPEVQRQDLIWEVGPFVLGPALRGLVLLRDPLSPVQSRAFSANGAGEAEHYPRPKE